MTTKIFAKKILNSYGKISLPINVNEIAKINDISIEEVVVEGFEGILLAQNKNAIIGINKKIREPGRKRFTIAHELGHYHLPNHLTEQKSIFQCTQQDVTNHKDGIENEANEFAVELLMPEELFKEKIRHKTLSYTTIADLAEQFQTSLTSTAIRFVQFSHDYAMVFSTNGFIKWIKKGKAFPYFLSPGKLSDDTFAIEFYKNGELPQTFQEVPAHAWADRVSPSKIMKELSIPLPYYNSVISFLYVEEADEDNDVEELDGHLRFR